MRSIDQGSCDPSLLAAYQIRAFIQDKHVQLAREHGWDYASPDMRWRRPVDKEKGPYPSQGDQLQQGLVLRQDGYSWPDTIDTKYGTLRILKSGAGNGTEGGNLLNELKESLGLERIHVWAPSKEAEPIEEKGNPRWAITKWQDLPIETVEYAEEGEGPLYTSEKVKETWEEVLVQKGHPRKEKSSSWPKCEIL